MRFLKKSRYAFFVKKENGEYIVYSSLSGSVIRFYEDTYIGMLEAIMDEDVVQYEDNEFFNTMLGNKILLDDAVNEELVVRGLYEEQVIRSNILDIMLIVTRQCNFRCIYCGQPHLDVKMTNGHFCSILNFIKKQVVLYGYKKVRVTFFGGEPLLESEKICSFLEKLGEILHDISSSQNEITYEAGMSTNGYLLTPHLFDELIKLHCNFYQISIKFLLTGCRQLMIKCDRYCLENQHGRELLIICPTWFRPMNSSRLR